MTDGSPKRILIIEDNPDFVFGLRNNLEFEGYGVEIAEDGKSGIERFRAEPPDLLILDLMMPGIDGFHVLKALRDEGYRTPVIILTARTDEADKVLGFRLGADDYVTKPFGVLELLERVQAVLRRASPGARAAAPPAAVERFGDVELDPARRLVSKGGSAVTLSPRSFDLLLALARRKGAVATRAELLREVWGHVFISSRTIDSHITELRQKLEDQPADPRHILTVYKAGYRLQA